MLKNLPCGSLWQDILRKNHDKLILPLTLYFDDFETSNPLGSHSGVYKVVVVYFCISSIPPEYKSRLENIFLTLIFHTSERFEFGNRATFNCLLDELKVLETEGIEIQTSAGVKTIYFNTMFIIGDHLGLHSILIKIYMTTL